MEAYILEVERLCKYFFRRRRRGRFLFKPQTAVIRAVNDCGFRVQRGETYCVVGESGSGKTTLARTIAHLYEPTAGSITLDGLSATHLEGESLKSYRRKVQMVFQDPSASLNPRQTIENIISLPLRVHNHLSRQARKHRVRELLELVQLPAAYAPRYPHALSGGQKQRVGIARALASEPKMLLLDEPTSALDVSVQAKMLELLSSLQSRLGLTYFLITHNLSIVRNLADHIAVMYLGSIVEHGSAEDIFDNSLHPYTRALLSAIPVITEAEREHIPEEITLDGEIPSPTDIPKTCYFLSRCQDKLSTCEACAPPELIEARPGHWVGCYHHGSSQGTIV
jgi:oligopeptide/dipeptide ABC transporter ATP-binding protein